MSAVLVESHEGVIKKMPETSSNAGFTQQDRDILTKLCVQMDYLREDISSLKSRLTRVEETRLTSRDLQELMSDTDTLRAEKKALEEKFEQQKVKLEGMVSAYRDHLEARITVLEAWRWKMLGASGAVGALVGGTLGALFKAAH